ncbi:MAG: isoleucine--tRNA ligase [Pirellulaceae bacterium]|nr:isoleucine--tRNA ligase [Pirellulaceae bacterium]
MFKAVSTQVRFSQQEEEILDFWKSHSIYAKSLQQRSQAPPFVFYEGPPTANGMPHPGHCLTRAIKDLFPRYKTMRGYRCERKAGWDTHGLPVEVEVCKQLNIHGKDEIEAYGIEPFIHKCQQSVWRYMQQWERLTERIGFWIDLNQAYVTYHQSFVESVWWSLKNLYDRGLLYRGHKIVWWWAQGGTALSSGEVGQGYRQVADPSVYVKFPLVDQPDTSLVVWTTTPWTLPSNTFAAVRADIDYAVCRDQQSGEQLIVAAELQAAIADKTKRQWSVQRIVQGRDLVGQRYVPPSDNYYRTLADAQGTLIGGQRSYLHWHVVAADFVTLDSGTGLVHIAPAFGEVDYELLVAEQARYAADSPKPSLLCAVGPDGKFTDDYPPQKGVWVKDADKAITRQLKEDGRLLFLDQYLHDYPFCWRAEQDPLIQYPRESWFIRTTQFRDAMLANNSQIGWLPENIRDGRFGNFLQSNVDWALSRERYWGTPLPIWQCEQTGHREAISSYAELIAKPGAAGMEVWQRAKQADPELVEDLKVHKPYIDAVTYDSPFAPGSTMRRVPEVIDCWYDSGAMPFAQWGYPHQGQRQFEAAFPADFISEAIDQTRGWFYSQLAISTMLFGDPSGKPTGAGQQPFPHPFRNCIVLGLMLAEWYESKDGRKTADGAACLTEEDARQAFGDGNYALRVGKMSKQLRNYRSPQEIFDTYGADALRWYFYANQPPWSSIIYSERAIRDSIPEFMLRIWNVLSFFTMYAQLDKFAGPAEITDSLDQLTAAELAGAASYRPIAQRGELDRWIMSELSSTVAEVIQRMDGYDSYTACQRINAFVDGLSNWYLRRCRDRFWGESLAGQSVDKSDAYWTLYEVLVELSKLIAPFVPFLAEAIWQSLTLPVLGRVRESVHLCDFPNANVDHQDELLAQRMSLLREIASLGRSARMDAKLKVRQPLASVQVSLTSDQHTNWLDEHDEIVKAELNVKHIHYNTGNSQYIEYKIVPNFKLLGPKVGKLMPLVKKHLEQADGAALLTEMNQQNCIRFEIQGQQIQLDDQDVQVRLQAKSGWTAAQGRQSVVVLSTELTPELIAEGNARDLVRLIQDFRKSLNLQRDARIELCLDFEQGGLSTAVEQNRSYIISETLTVVLHLRPVPDDVPSQKHQIAGQDVTIGIQVAKT